MENLDTQINSITEFEELKNVLEKYDISIESLCALLSSFMACTNRNNNHNEALNANLFIEDLQALAQQITKNPHMINTNECTIRTKQLIENTCFSLNSIAKANLNRFVFMNIDMPLRCNKSLLSRIILNTCFHILTIAEKYSVIKVLSYAENATFTIEFITSCKPDYQTQNITNSISPMLSKIEGEFFCERISQTETAFKIVMPYENTHF